MTDYIQGFVIPIAKDKLGEYEKIAQVACTVWMEHGAIDYRECILEDDTCEGVPFTKLAQCKDGETVVFAWVTYKSKSDSETIMKKVMEDPRMKDSCTHDSMPFDMKRMTYGGFDSLVSV